MQARFSSNILAPSKVFFNAVQPQIDFGKIVAKMVKPPLTCFGCLLDDDSPDYE